jgi:hypothetical protein
VTLRLQGAIKPKQHRRTSRADAAYKINGHDLNQYALTSLGFIPIITGILWLVTQKAQEYLPDSWYKQC